MLFNSPVFLFLFLPLCIGIYFALPKAFRNIHLTISSLVFFAWGSIPYTLLLLVSTLINYAFGLLAATVQTRKKLWLVLGVLVNLGILIYYKYAGFFVENYNVLASFFGGTSQAIPDIILPIGISFYTFHGMSYQIDVYRGSVKAQRNFFDLLLYKTFFPQLIAGPIVRYNQIAAQIKDRSAQYSDLVAGLKIFLTGLAKKVLVANSFAYAADSLWGIQVQDMATQTAWLALLAYTFQIYIDFSAYSDMAIGLARMVGFHFPENFNFPYLATGFKDFWSRWHISLSSWFRDYLYIPLGGNKRGTARTLLNLWIVFLCTGFWHGASWSFVLWGVIHGLYLTIERLVPALGKLPKLLRLGFTFFLVMLAWVPFRADTLEQTLAFYSKLAGMGQAPVDHYYVYMQSNVLNPEFYTLAALGLLFSFGLGIKLQAYWTQLQQRGLFQIAETLYYTAIFWLCTMYIISGSYSPFIYFRF